MKECPHTDLSLFFHQSQLTMWRVMAFVLPKCVALDLLLSEAVAERWAEKHNNTYMGFINL